MEWIEEKKKPLLGAESGGDPELVKTMQRKHVGVLRELQSIEKNVGSLLEHGEKLIVEQPDNESKIREKLRELEERWGEVEEANEVHSDWLGKCSEVADFKKSHGELYERLDALSGEVGESVGEDVGGVEALLASHKELREAIEGEKEEADRLTLVGRQLADTTDTTDTEEFVSGLQDKIAALEIRCEEREDNLKNQLQLKTCYLDEEVIEVKMEDMAATMCQMTAADCTKLDHILSVEQDKISSLQAVKDKMTPTQADQIEARAGRMSDKFAELKQLQEKRKKELQDKSSVDSFLGDADEVMVWINERLLQCNVKPADLSSLQVTTNL